MSDDLSADFDAKAAMMDKLSVAREQQVKDDSLRLGVSAALKELVERVRADLPPSELDAELSGDDILSICCPQLLVPLWNPWKDYAPYPRLPIEDRAWDIFLRAIEYAVTQVDDSAAAVVREWPPVEGFVLLAQAYNEKKKTIKHGMMMTADELCSRRNINKERLDYMVLDGGLPAYYSASSEGFRRADHAFLRYSRCTNTIPIDFCLFRVFDIWDYERSEHGKTTLKFRPERLDELRVQDIGLWLLEFFPNVMLIQAVRFIRLIDAIIAAKGVPPFFAHINKNGDDVINKKTGECRDRTLRKYLRPLPFKKDAGRPRKNSE